MGFTEMRKKDQGSKVVLSQHKSSDLKTGTKLLNLEFTNTEFNSRHDLVWGKSTVDWPTGN